MIEQIRDSISDQPSTETWFQDIQSTYTLEISTTAGSNFIVTDLYPKYVGNAPDMRLQLVHDLGQAEGLAEFLVRAAEAMNADGKREGDVDLFPFNPSPWARVVLAVCPDDLRHAAELIGRAISHARALYIVR